MYIIYVEPVISLGKCPRCGNDSVKYGVVLLKVGKTRSVSASINVCGKCGLLFYEKTDEKPRFE
ncbi:MAG: hypothetical protein DRJ97_01835 [Thermoprotei archaeon]|nr:MAG: hypothetical protein DRJ97_01835 [Thermoprotei archaeon]